MKNLLLISTIIIFSALNLLAQGGVEVSVMAPFGVAISTPNKPLKQLGYKGGKGFDSGLEFHIGYMHKIQNRMGAGLFLDLAYNYDSFVLSKNVNNNIVDTSMYIHNLGIGFLPKFTVYGVTIGIGGGIKVPLAGLKKLEYGYSADVMHYFKLTLDYSFFINNNMAIVLGVYIAHDYGLPMRSLGETPRNGGSGGGATIGFKFGPKLED